MKEEEQEEAALTNRTVYHLFCVVSICYIFYLPSLVFIFRRLIN